MNLITSRENPLLKTLRRLAQESNAYRKLGQFWLEGDHLCRAALARGALPQRVVLAQSLAEPMTVALQTGKPLDALNESFELIFGEAGGWLLFFSCGGGRHRCLLDYARRIITAIAKKLSDLDALRSRQGRRHPRCSQANDDN